MLHVEDIAGEIQQAWHLACAGRPGPVHLSLPADVLEAESAADSREPICAHAPESSPLSPADVAAILAQLSAAKRPLILAGPAAGRHQSAAFLEAFSAGTGIRGNFPITGDTLQQNPGGSPTPL